nr:translocator protein isoform X1 [Camelus dromedarius]XP_031319257.1 translocator protein isoform X1 [Camelus dromedarius]
MVMPYVPAAMAFTLVPSMGGFLGSQYIRGEGLRWYAGLQKPSWHPPNWTLAPIWGTLYSAMGDLPRTGLSSKDPTEILGLDPRIAMEEKQDWMGVCPVAAPIRTAPRRQVWLLHNLERAGGLLGGGRGSPGPLHRTAGSELGVASPLLWRSTNGLGPGRPPADRRGGSSHSRGLAPGEPISRLPALPVPGLAGLCGHTQLLRVAGQPGPAPWPAAL